MKDNRGSSNISERLTGKRSRHASSSAPPKAAVPASPLQPRMVMTVEEMGKELGISRATAYELPASPGQPGRAPEMDRKAVLIEKPEPG